MCDSLVTDCYISGGYCFCDICLFTNRRIKKSLKDEELKNSKKGALLDSFRAGLIVEAILSLTKVSVGTAWFTIVMVAFGGGG